MSELYALYEHIDVFLIVFVRILAAIIFLPIIDETKMPRIALAGLALGISIAVYFQIDVAATYYQPTLLSFSFVLIKEMVVGLTLGFIVKLFFQIYAYVGLLLSMQGGLSMSIMMDPTSNTQATQLGRFYQLGLAALFVVSGGYHWFTKTLVESFSVLPIAEPIIAEHVALDIVYMMKDYLEIGLKLAMPIVSVIVIVDFALGILARTVPQMNMFVIGIPIKMLILFVLLIVTVPTVIQYNQIIIEKLVQAVNEVMWGLKGT